MSTITQALEQVEQRISTAATQFQRDRSDIQLLAVSKKQTPSKIREAYLAGQRCFGENYLQEARDKQAVLQELDIEWHFIGPIQSNKTREIAENFNWVHSVDRLKVAQRLSNQRPKALPPLNLCLQVNIDDEKTKSGVQLDQLSLLIKEILPLPQLKLRGLMAIPARRTHYPEQLAIFQQVANLQQELSLSHPEFIADTLSLGMSADIEAAIEAGSTIVRVGTDIFGARD